MTDNYPEISDIDEPTPLFHGSGFQVILLSTSLTVLDRIDDSRIHVLGRCDHRTQIEHAAAFM